MSAKAIIITAGAVVCGAAIAVGITLAVTRQPAQSEADNAVAVAAETQPAEQADAAPQAEAPATPASEPAKSQPTKIAATAADLAKLAQSIRETSATIKETVGDVKDQVDEASQSVKAVRDGLEQKGDKVTDAAETALMTAQDVRDRIAEGKRQADATIARITKAIDGADKQLQSAKTKADDAKDSNRLVSGVLGSVGNLAENGHGALAELRDELVKRVQEANGAYADSLGAVEAKLAKAQEKSQSTVTASKAVTQRVLNATRDYENLLAKVRAQADDSIGRITALTKF